MPSTAESITNLESCLRRALWAESFEPQQLHPTVILRKAIYEGLLTERDDCGEAAGEHVMELAGDRGFDIDTSVVHVSLYDTALHYAALADIIVTHLRDNGGKWSRPEPCDGHIPDCLRDPNGTLKRIILPSRWDEERQAQELHSWFNFAEMVAYRERMTMEVVILGQSRKARRHSAWSRGHLHPRNRQLRFKRNAHYGQRDKPFGENWIPVWREDHDQLTREQWLEAMEADAMFEDLHLSIPIVLPGAANMQRLRDLIARKTERLEKLKGLPEPSYSACHNPINPCQFQGCCLETPESKPAAPRFVSICTQDLLAT